MPTQIAFRQRREAINCNAQMRIYDMNIEGCMIVKGV